MEDGDRGETRLKTEQNKTGNSILLMYQAASSQIQFDTAESGCSYLTEESMMRTVWGEIENEHDVTC